jgi:hypothetical protein
MTLPVAYPTVTLRGKAVDVDPDLGSGAFLTPGSGIRISIFRVMYP